MTGRQIINKLHLYLGLGSGLIVFILGVTGCLFVFQPEITHWLRHDLRHADVRQSAPLPVRQLQKIAANALDLDHLHYGLVTFRDPARNWQAMSYQSSKGGWTYFGSIKDYRTIYINPYTGRIGGIVNEEHDFFQIVKGIHWSLLLATPIGQPIVVWSTVVFIIVLLIGLVLWWPRHWKRSAWKKSFCVRWKGSLKRLNYDLHNVFGFYALIVLLVIAFTGLYWYFPAVKKSIYFLGTGDFAQPSRPIVRSSGSTPRNAGTIKFPMRQAYKIAWSRFPQASNITFEAPAKAGGFIKAIARPSEGVYYHASVSLFDSRRGELVGQRLYSDKNAGEKLLAMNYDIHVGAIGGLWTKTIAFIASFIAASLPVTGFLYWFPAWKRKRRRKRKDPSALSVEVVSS